MWGERLVRLHPPVKQAIDCTATSLRFAYFKDKTDKDWHD
jgi:hypothetical protein